MRDDEDTIEGELVTRSSTDAVLGTLTKAETDMQISTAKTYPRSIKRFLNEARDLCTLNEEVAGDCLYALPRSGKMIEGPSARFAEIIVSAWGNIHAAARVVGQDDKFVTAQSVVWDLEKNVRLAFEVRRRITDKYGKTYNDDMIGVTGSAAASIAYRNAVFKVIPKAIWHPLYLEARRVAVGDEKTLEVKRTAALAALKKLGVTEPQILAFVEAKGVEDIGLDELAVLRGAFTAIRDEGASIESVFNKPVEGSKVGRSTIAPKPPEKPAEQPKQQQRRQPVQQPVQEEPEYEGSNEPPGGFEDSDYDPALDEGGMQDVSDGEGHEGPQEVDHLSVLLSLASDPNKPQAEVLKAIKGALAENLISRQQADRAEMELQTRLNQQKQQGTRRRQKPLV